MIGNFGGCGLKGGALFWMQQVDFPNCCNRRMNNPDAIDTETLGESAVTWGHLLYGLFSQVLQGKAASICMRVQRGNGLEVWRQVVKEYEPNLAERHTAVLMSLLNPWVEGKYGADLSLFVVDLLESWTGNARLLGMSRRRKTPLEIA